MKRRGYAVIVVLVGLVVAAWLVERLRNRGPDADTGTSTTAVAHDSDEPHARRSRWRLFGRRTRDPEAARDETPEPLPDLIALGRVIDHDTKDPIPGATIEVRTHDDPTLLGSTSTDSEGRFSIPIPQQYLWAHVRADGYAYQRSPLFAEPGEEQTIELVRGVRVEGIATSVRGPVPDVRVACHPQGLSWESDDTTTDAEGAFVLTNCQAGRIKLTTQAEDWARSERLLDGEHEAGDVIRGVKLELIGGQQVVGQVHMPDGTPAVDAVVTAGDTSLEGFSLIHAPRVRTNERGEFDLGVLAAQSWYIVAIGSDGETTYERIELEVDADPKNLELTLPEGMEITGRVVSNGSPVEEATVGFLRDTRSVDEEKEPGVAVRELVLGGTGAGNYRREATTDEHGRFRVGGLERGIYTAFVTHDDYPAKHFEDLEAGARDITLELPARTLLNVELVSSEGARVSVSASAFAATFDPDTGKPLGKAGLRIEEGHLAEHGINPGTYELQVFLDEGPSPDPAPFVAKEGDTVDLKVVLPKPVTVTGRVLTPGGTPLEGVRIAEPTPVWTAAAGSWRFASETGGTRTGADGTFEVLSRAGGRLLIYHPEYRSYLARLPVQIESKPFDLGDIVLEAGPGRPFFHEHDLEDLKAKWER